MADFAAWVVAAEEALGWPEGDFLRAYLAGANEAQDVVLEASTLGEPIRELLDNVGSWEGTAKELLAALSGRVGDELRQSKAWPKSAKSISGSVRRLAPTLRAIGIEVEFHREKTSSRRRLITLCRETGISTVRTVQPSSAQAEVVDGVDDLDGSVPTVGRRDAGDDIHASTDWPFAVSPEEFEGVEVRL
jgi:hypothetical protein